MKLDSKEPACSAQSRNCRILTSAWIATFALGSYSVMQKPALAEAPDNAQKADSQNKVITLRDSGVEPRELRMSVADSGIFFLNKTESSLATIEVDFGKKETHCASTNLEILENGVVRSSHPFQPRDFASICVHDTGTYPFKIYGLEKAPGGITGTITVGP
jgi:hypothetical protein